MSFVIANAKLLLIINNKLSTDEMENDMNESDFQDLENGSKFKIVGE